MQGQFRTVTNDHQLQLAIDSLVARYKEHGSIQVQIEKASKQRTPKQQASIEIYCKAVAAVLTESGFTLTHALNQAFRKIEVMPTQANVKETMFKPLVNALFGKSSTTDLETGELNKVYENMELVLSGRLHVIPPPRPSRGRNE